jgi:hypothetical protein
MDSGLSSTAVTQGVTTLPKLPTLPKLEQPLAVFELLAFQTSHGFLILAILAILAMV